MLTNSNVIQEAESSRTTRGLPSTTVCIYKRELSKGINLLLNRYVEKLFLFLPFPLSSLLIIFNKCDDSVFGKSDSFSFSHFVGAMSREGHSGHRENSIVLITAMIDRLCYEMSGEREREAES